MVLVRLPLTAGLDIEANAFGVSGGENGVRRSCSIGGDAGVSGKGFSLLRLLVLLACLNFGGDRGEPLRPEVSSGEAADEVSSVCMLPGLCRPPDNDPSLRMPFRTPDRKSPFSTSSSVAESENLELDSIESVVR